MSGGPGAEALRSPPRGGGGGRGRGLLEVGQRLGPVVPETPGRWVDPGRRTRVLSYGRAPLRAASRRPGWFCSRGRTGGGRSWPERCWGRSWSGAREETCRTSRSVWSKSWRCRSPPALSRLHRRTEVFADTLFPSVFGGFRCRLRSDDHPRGLDAPSGLRGNCPEAPSQSLKVIAEVSPPPRAPGLTPLFRWF